MSLNDITLFWPFSKHLWMNWRSRLINFYTFITQVWFFHQREVWSLLVVSLLLFCSWKHCSGKILHLFCYLPFQLLVTQHRSASRNTIGMFMRRQVCVSELHYHHFLYNKGQVWQVLVIFTLYSRKKEFLRFWKRALWVSYKLVSSIVLNVTLLTLKRRDFGWFLFKIWYVSLNLAILT